MALPDYLQVWPAHGAGSVCGKALGAVPQSTVGYERISSPILKLVGDEQRFVDDILSGQPEPPLYFARMKVLNRDGVPVLGHLPQPPLVQDLSNRPELTDPKLAVVVDTRPWNEFRRGHLPGALHAVPGKMFPMVVGSFVRPEEPIVLVCDSLRSDELVRDLVRIGYDQILAVVPPTALAAYPELVQEPEETVQGLARAAESGAALVLDVRGASEHAAGAVKGSLNTAYTRLPRALATLPRERRILVHCASGGRSAAATAYLRREGFDAMNVEGGFGAWRKADLPVHMPAPGATATQCCSVDRCRA
jgi:hydroxyacylglutathione hydrolase